MKITKQQLADLLRFEIRNSERHALPEIRISVARARTLLADLDADEIKPRQTPAFFSRWKKARKAHLETCKNAQREIEKLHAENICLQELIQEFYEWSHRDYPTEQEVREIMNRYHDLLNK